jgi:5,10-methylenetetrahydrofolate reductase
MVQSFRETLKSGKFIVTSEIGPPKGTNIEKMRHHIDIIKDKVDALNVTDHQSSVMRFPSLGGCLHIKEQGGEPILQMTCRDRNRMALQADLLFAYTRGIRNVLCLTGDAVPVGDNKEARGVFELDSVQLLRAVRQMESGKDMGSAPGPLSPPRRNPLSPSSSSSRKRLRQALNSFRLKLSTIWITSASSWIMLASSLSRYWQA